MRSGLRNADPRTMMLSVRGWLYGAAVGGALGSGVRFDSGPAIVHKYGPLGPGEFADVFGRPGAITSDMQLTLLGVDAMIRSHIRSSWHETDRLEEIRRSLRRWLLAEQDGWFPSNSELFQRRWADRTTVEAIRTYAEGGELGTVEQPINDSQGNSALLRSGVAALWSDDSSVVFEIGARIGAMTHGHPNAYLSAGAYAVMLQHAFDSGDLQRAIVAALDALQSWEHHEPVSAALTAVHKAIFEPPRLDPATMEGFGDSTTALGALAIGARAANASLRFPNALGPALIISGDTATTGAIAGSLAGASCGSRQIPEHQVEGIELAEPIQQLADLACLEFGNSPPQEAGFYEGFPFAPA